MTTPNGRFVYLAALASALLPSGSPQAQTPPSPSDARSAYEPPAQPPAVDYQQWFSHEAMRVDLLHSGTDKESSYSLDEVAWEPLWPGTRRYLLDPFGFGTYRFRVTDAETGKEIFRLGYATLFDEWSGTPEALSGVHRSMSESVRFPWPRRPVGVHIDRRDKAGLFQEMFALTIDPSSHMISRMRPSQGWQPADLSGGPPADRALDVLIVPEGYGDADREKLRADLKRFSEVFLNYEPWKSHRSAIHLRAVEALSHESGVTEPRKGIFHDSLLGASFNTFDSERYLTLLHTKKLRQIASLAPYDTLFIMVNSSRYGGGGVYNQWSVFVSDNEYDDYVMLHEYGHHMGGLADEYYDSAIASDEDLMYPPGIEPWEPNLSAFLGKSRERIKWGERISASTPVPTPEQGAASSVVGLFEGAGYKTKGLFRPQKDCKMFHKGLVGFCQVCTQALVSMLHYYTGEDLRP
jgi:hypothetical protein